MSGFNDIEDELNYRIQADIRAFNGDLPERYSLAWLGYLAGLYEWSVIDMAAYAHLTDLLPSVQEPNPIITIFTGREEEESHVPCYQMGSAAQERRNGQIAICSFEASGKKRGREGLNKDGFVAYARCCARASWRRNTGGLSVSQASQRSISIC